MKEQFQNIELNNVMSFLKAVNLYRRIWRNFQQDQISPTNCFSTTNASTESDRYRNLFLKKQKQKKTPTFLLQNDSLKKTFSKKPGSFYKMFPY